MTFVVEEGEGSYIFFAWSHLIDLHMNSALFLLWSQLRNDYIYLFWKQVLLILTVNFAIRLTGISLFDAVNWRQLLKVNYEYYVSVSHVFFLNHITQDENLVYISSELKFNVLYKMYEIICVWLRLMEINEIRSLVVLHERCNFKPNLCSTDVCGNILH